MKDKKELRWAGLGIVVFYFSTIFYAFFQEGLKLVFVSNEQIPLTNGLASIFCMFTALLCLLYLNKPRLLCRNKNENTLVKL